ncbi:hypothetical protein DV515_00009498 [Chloebia gouldiae]|uniref:Uncharacterized protein n=1 Tax=Chloebia gouldiae TaxID=44316 RepID=A0A3L8SDW8_CHLGU|nr:hypothetical protein DV515_00009498 [Chloebia gouldiae]
MDDDVPLILTLDDSGSSASAPLDELDREELPNEIYILIFARKEVLINPFHIFIVFLPKNLEYFQTIHAVQWGTASL